MAPNQNNDFNSKKQNTRNRRNGQGSQDYSGNGVSDLTQIYWTNQYIKKTDGHEPNDNKQNLQKEQEHNSNNNKNNKKTQMA